MSRTFLTGGFSKSTKNFSMAGPTSRPISVSYRERFKLKTLYLLTRSSISLTPVGSLVISASVIKGTGYSVLAPLAFIFAIAFLMAAF